MSRFNVGNIPSEVLWVWAVQRYAVGLDTMKKMTDIIARHPKYFPWEHLYDSIPAGVHEAFQRECYPERFKPFAEVIPPGDGLIYQISSPREDTLTEAKMCEIIEALDERDRMYDESRKRRSRIWNKHYSKYGLKERL